MGEISHIFFHPDDLEFRNWPWNIIATYDILLKMFTPSLDLYVYIYTYFSHSLLILVFLNRKLKKDSLKLKYSMGVSPFDSFETFPPTTSPDHPFGKR